MSKLFAPGYYNEDDLRSEGFKSIGNNVIISKNCTIIGVENISIGDNVRIDGYCTILAPGEGYVKIGSYVHIGAYCYLQAGSGIEIDDFTNLSQGVRIYSRSDDYTGNYLVGPTIPEKYTYRMRDESSRSFGFTQGTVRLCRHTIIGSGSVILPRVTVGEGSVVGSLSLVTKTLSEWGIYFGCSVKRIGERSKRILELEKEFMQEVCTNHVS